MLRKRNILLCKNIGWNAIKLLEGDEEVWGKISFWSCLEFWASAGENRSLIEKYDFIQEIISEVLVKRVKGRKTDKIDYLVVPTESGISYFFGNYGAGLSSHFYIGRPAEGISCHGD